MAGGPETFDKDENRVNANNIDIETNDIGFKDLDTDSGFREGSNRNENILHQLEEIEDDFEKDKNKKENSEEAEDSNDKSPLDKIRPEASSKIPAIAVKTKESKEKQVTLQTLLKEVIKGLDLPPGKTRDLANEVEAIAGKNLTPQELKDNFSPKAIAIYEGIQSLSFRIEKDKEVIQKYVMEHLND